MGALPPAAIAYTHIAGEFATPAQMLKMPAKPKH
jgi:hypothetical protein